MDTCIRYNNIYIYNRGNQNYVYCQLFPKKSSWNLPWKKHHKHVTYYILIVVHMNLTWSINTSIWFNMIISHKLYSKHNYFTQFHPSGFSTSIFAPAPLRELRTPYWYVTEGCSSCGLISPRWKIKLDWGENINRNCKLSSSFVDLLYWFTIDYVLSVIFGCNFKAHFRIVFHKEKLRNPDR